MGTPLRVLIVEDSEIDALMLILELQQGGYELLHEQVETVEAVRTALQDKAWDIILCDYYLSGFNGLQVLAIVKEMGIDVPFILISGAIGEELAVEAMKAGAHDYIMKDRRQRLLPAVKRELREAVMRREHRRVETAFRESEGKFRLLVENAPDAVFVQVGGSLAYLNPAAIRLFGAGSAEALLGSPLMDHVHPEYRELARERMRLLNEERIAVRVIGQRYLKLDGSVIDVEVSAVPITYENHDGALVFVRDITDRKRAEDEQHRSREIAERLAGDLAVVAEIGRLIGSTLAIDEVYERVAAEARKRIPFDRLSVSLNDPRNGTQTVAYVSGFDIPNRRPGESFPLPGTVNELLMQMRRGLLIPSTEIEELALRLPGLITVTDADVRSVMSVPLIVRDEVIGALHFRSKKPDTYTPEDLRLAERIGEQIAGAIANARLFKELQQTDLSLREAEEQQRRNRETAERLAGEMAVIAEIGRVIGSTLNIEEVYERFAAEARKLLPFDSLMVNLNREEENTLVIAYVSGVDIPDRMKGDLIPFKGSVCEVVTRKREGMLLQSDSVEESIKKFPTLIHVFQVGLNSMMFVPLLSADKVIGALVFRKKKRDAYTTEDLRLAERIGAQIAGAIANAQLFDDLKKTEYSLRESEKRLRALFEQVAVGVAEVEIGTGRFLTVNRRLCELFGMTEEEVLATTFLALTHPEDIHLHEGYTAQLVAGEITHYRLEKRYIRKDGAIVWTDLVVSMLSSPGEASGRTIAVVQDITDRRRMQEENERRSRQLALLHETSVELSAELNLNELLQAIARRALDLIGGVYCNCYLYQPEQNLMERVAAAGQELFPTKTLRKRGEGFVGHIWATGAPLLVDDYRSWPVRKREYDSFPSRALVGAPIRWGDDFLGVLDIMSYAPHRYTQTDMDMLCMFAMQAAIAIRNARLYTQIEQIAVTDELTGLFNRRGFFPQGEREFERAVRFNRPLAAVMFDIDHFKRVNDTHGHLAGDQVLQALAVCFRQNTRGIDVVGRYGGEEFIILLPETLLPEAIQIAERLRLSIAELSIPVCPANGDSTTINVRITASAGIAVVMPDVRTLNILIDLTDQALYRAKAAGRNRIVVWHEAERSVSL